MPTLRPFRDVGQTVEKDQKTHIILLVDASGSMSPYVKETKQTIFSIMSDLNDKKNIHFTLVFFDTSNYNVIQDDWTEDIIPELSRKYKALCSTPITDSVYKSIQDITMALNNIEALSEKHKFIIFTDGEENSSQYVKSEDLGRAIEHFTESFGWDFQFIGPKSQEVGILQYANSIKIKPENLTLYASVSEGLEKMKEKVVN